MSERPGYLPPFQFGEGRRSGSPRRVFRGLLLAPVVNGAFAVWLLLHGRAIAGVVAGIFSLVAVVQALIYAPRALKAARREGREP